MTLKFEEERKDSRGNMFFFSYGDKNVNIFEIKKGQARAGHFHPSESSHIIVSGKIEYREEDSVTGNESVRIVEAPIVIKAAANNPHLVIAIEDTILVEVFEKDYSATNYPKYRKIVEEKMKNMRV